MPTKRDVIIHLHNSDATALNQVEQPLLQDEATKLYQGELAVINSETYQTIVHLNHDGTALVNYPTETKVANMITESVTSGEVHDALTAITENITEIEGDITNINSAITEIQGDIQEINTGITGIQQTISGIQEDITGITEDITELNSNVTANKVVAADNSITVVPGDATDQDPLNTSISVKLDPDGGIQVGENGLEVVQSAITPYVGSNAITVTTGTSQHTIALKINANDHILTQSTSGLTAGISLVKLGAATEGYLASYQLQGQDGTALGQTIDIPKDFFIKSGSIATVETPDTPYSGAIVGDKYLDLVINVADSSEDEQHIYIPVKELVDVYTAGNGIDVSGSNVISAKVAADDKYITVDGNGIHVKPTTGSTSGNTAIDDSIETAVNDAKEEIQGQLDALQKASIVTISAATTDPILVTTVTATTGNTVTLSTKIATAAEIKTAAYAENDEITEAILDNRLKVTSDGKLYVSSIIDGGTF